MEEHELWPVIAMLYLETQSVGEVSREPVYNRGVMIHGHGSDVLGHRFILEAFQWSTAGLILLTLVKFCATIRKH